MPKSVLILVIGLLAILPVHAQVNDYEPVIEYDTCPFTVPAGETEGETLDCGYLSVPEARDNADSAWIDLAVVILYSPAADAAPDPLIYLAGGPGGSAVLEVEDWAQSVFRAQRDIILIDQRGVGYSFPALECDDFMDSEDPDQACYEWLVSSDIDLSAYNSAASAADIADLWQTLELDDVNLYGVSYGTRLALTILRDYPDGIRSVVLDSTYPPHVNSMNEEALHGGQAMLHLFEQCALSPACADAYGDLETTFLQLVDDFNQSPAATLDPETDEEIELTGDDLVDTLFQSLYVTSAIPTLPYAIYLIEAGDYLNGMDILGGGYTMADLNTLAAGGVLDEPDAAPFDDDAPDGDSEGLFNAVECAEEAPFNTLADAEALAANLPAQLADSLVRGTEQQLATCALWGSGTADALENEPVSSDIPTLVLAGSFDPVTPPVWGQAAADYLSHSTYIEFPHAGHGILDSGACATGIIQDFLSDPQAVPDADCVNDIRLDFFVPDVCTISPLGNVDVFDEPTFDADVIDSLDASQTDMADAISSDGEYYWLRLAGDNGWVPEDVVDFPDSCFMLPFLEE